MFFTYNQDMELSRFTVILPFLQVEDEKKIEPRANFRTISENPTAIARLYVCDVVTTTPFDMLIAVFIVTNIISMAFESYKQASWQIRYAPFKARMQKVNIRHKRMFCRRFFVRTDEKIRRQRI